MTEFDTRRIRELLDQRDDIDRQLAEIIIGTVTVKERKPQACSICQKIGHSSRTCPDKPQA